MEKRHWWVSLILGIIILALGAAVLWQYGLKHFVEPHVAQGNIQNDVQNQPQ